MPQSLALLLWLIALLCLLAFDPAKDRRVSPALWLPIIWLVLLASRSASQWLNLSTTLEEGNPLDHVIYLGLTFLAVGVLAAGFRGRVAPRSLASKSRTR